MDSALAASSGQQQMFAGAAAGLFGKAKTAPPRAPRLARLVDPEDMKSLINEICGNLLDKFPRWNGTRIRVIRIALEFVGTHSNNVWPSHWLLGRELKKRGCRGYDPDTVGDHMRAIIREGVIRHITSRTELEASPSSLHYPKERRGVGETNTYDLSPLYDFVRAAWLRGVLDRVLAGSPLVTAPGAPPAEFNPNDPSTWVNPFDQEASSPEAPQKSAPKAARGSANAPRSRSRGRATHAPEAPAGAVPALSDPPAGLAPEGGLITDAGGTPAPVPSLSPLPHPGSVSMSGVADINSGSGRRSQRTPATKKDLVAPPQGTIFDTVKTPYVRMGDEVAGATVAFTTAPATEQARGWVPVQSAPGDRPEPMPLHKMRETEAWKLLKAITDPISGKSFGDAGLIKLFREHGEARAWEYAVYHAWCEHELKERFGPGWVMKTANARPTWNQSFRTHLKNVRRERAEQKRAAAEASSGGAQQARTPFPRPQNAPAAPPEASTSAPTPETSTDDFQTPLQRMWEGALVLLAQRIIYPSFTGQIQNLLPVAMEELDPQRAPDQRRIRVTLGATNGFAKERAQSKHEPSIRQAVEEVLGAPGRVLLRFVDVSPSASSSSPEQKGGGSRAGP